MIACLVIFFLETPLSKSEKAVIMEFEMDCIANMLRDKSCNPVKE